MSYLTSGSVTLIISMSKLLYIGQSGEGILWHPSNEPVRDCVIPDLLVCHLLYEQIHVTSIESVTWGVSPMTPRSHRDCVIPDSRAYISIGLASYKCSPEENPMTPRSHRDCVIPDPRVYIPYLAPINVSWGKTSYDTPGLTMLDAASYLYPEYPTSTKRPTPASSPTGTDITPDPSDLSPLYDLLQVKSYPDIVYQAI